MPEDFAIEPPYHPIIYVRGFAGSETEIEDTVADPYMGFNAGSTKFRQAWTGAVRRHYFESPLVRLVKDFGYRDVYSDGVYMPPGEPVHPRSVIIYRYYDRQFFDDIDHDDGSGLPPIPTGRLEDEVSGERREIEAFAAGLAKLILQARRRICGDDADAARTFRVHLIGHSMGGLVIRCFLQHIGHGGSKVAQVFGERWAERFRDARDVVDKVFTYATPHNGIDMGIIGNVPGFFTKNNADNFNRARMQQYLDLPKWSQDEGRMDNLYGRFDVDRFFSLIGTNHQDYAVLYGWSRRLVGPMSDGLVRIGNAAVHSRPSHGAPRAQGPRALVQRSHSGHFGIVNSEEGYQNLVRFLFGNVRVDGTLVVDEVTLPKPMRDRKAAGDEIRASYHVECVVTVRGIGTELHRRTVGDGSAILRSYDSLVGNGEPRRDPHLFSLFLSSRARVNDEDPSLGFAVDLGVKVPEYTYSGILWRERSYPGDDLLRVTLHVEATPPADGGEWKLRYGIAGAEREHGVANKPLQLQEVDGGRRAEIALKGGRDPRIAARLVLFARTWE